MDETAGAAKTYANATAAAFFIEVHSVCLF